MLRRASTIVSGMFCVTGIALLLLQPVRVKTKLFNYIAQSIPPSVPYEVHIERVSGSFIRGLSFDDVCLVERKSQGELLRIRHLFLKWSWRALLFHKQFQINRMVVDLDKGKAVLQGVLTLSPVPSGHYEVVDDNFPMQKLAAFVGQTPPAMSLRHTGRWTIQKDSGTIVVNFGGRLENSPVAFHLTWNPDPRVLLNGGGEWTSPLADIHMRFHRGIGDYEGIVGSAGIRSVVKGQIDLPQKIISGQAVLNLQKVNDKAQPSDIQTAKVTFLGRWPRFNTQASLGFRDGSQANIQGHLIHANEAWILEWKKASFSFPLAGTWTSLRPGTASWSEDRVTIQNAEFGNGAQNVKLTSAHIADKQFHFDLTANQLNLAPWTKLFFPDVTLEGNLNTSLRVSGTPKELHVDGYLQGQISKLDVNAIGLSLQDIDVELRSRNQKVEIVRFSGKSKKGDFQLDGSSVLPQLAYALHVHHVSLEPVDKFKAVADADLALAGTWESPLLTGRVTLEEGNYNATKKSPRKNTSVPHAEPCCQSSRMDVSVGWARNVWYHEGVSSIETKADLRVQKKESSPITVTGQIMSLRGSYNYFGRNFNIESGQMQFMGEPGFNPVLTLEASYTSGPTMVYLDMGGTIEHPTLTMHSTPPLPQQDILSVIVFGQPLSTIRATSGSGTSNQEAMQAVGGVLGTYIAKGLNQSGMSALNLDVINIQPTDQGGSQLILGRYLTRRLFVNYGQSVQGSAEKTITADYFLTDKWTMQGVSDSLEGDYLDFLFRYPLNKRKSVVNTSPVPHSPFRDTLDTPDTQPQFRTPLQ